MIKEIETFHSFIRNGGSLRHCTIQELDFRRLDINWASLTIEHTVFLGCQFVMEDQIYLLQQGAFIYQAPTDLPYRPFRKKLYTWQSLETGADNSIDQQIYQHFETHKRNTNINEALWQRIHDHAIDDAMRELIAVNDQGVPDLKCVGIMGGHSTKRTSPDYLMVAQTAKRLAEAGYFIVSGGGPGIMEAANLGAFLANKSDNSLMDAIDHMASAPSFTSPEYIEKSIDVYKMHRSPHPSLAIPTWFYGHEPSNVFATHIAKYFSNSIREDTLLAICLWGVIFAPGKAGTVQEIFMDAAQNHYGTHDFYSPMVFMGKDYYDLKTNLYGIVRRLAHGKQYYDLLSLTDQPDEVVSFLQSHPPVSTNK